MDHRDLKNLMIGFLICLAMSANSIALADHVKLSWTDGNDKIDGYKIFQRLDGEDYDFDQAPAWTGSSKSCVIRGLVAGNTYFFVSRTYLGNVESLNSNEVKFTVPPEIIIDDTDAGNQSKGRWQTSGGTSPYGSGSLYSKDIGATYAFAAPLDGEFELFVWWSSWHSRSSAVPIKIYDGQSLISSVSVDQSRGGGQWNSVGIYTFSNQARVVITADSDADSTCADAIKLVPAADPGAPAGLTVVDRDLIIDEINLLRLGIDKLSSLLN